MPENKPAKSSAYSDHLNHSAGARGTQPQTSTRQDGARSPKRRPQQPPKR